MSMFVRPRVGTCGRSAATASRRQLQRPRELMNNHKACFLHSASTPFAGRSDERQRRRPAVHNPFVRQGALCEPFNPSIPTIGQRRTFVDLSLAEIGVVVIVGSMLIGRKDLPVVTKAAGKIVGSAVGHLIRARQALTSFSEVSDIVSIRKELQEGVAELRNIRQDLYGFDTPQGGGNSQPTTTTLANAGGGVRTGAGFGAGDGASVGAGTGASTVNDQHANPDPAHQSRLASDLAPPPIPAASSGSDITQQVCWLIGWLAERCGFAVPAELPSPYCVPGANTVFCCRSPRRFFRQF